MNPCEALVFGSQSWNFWDMSLKLKCLPTLQSWSNESFLISSTLAGSVSYTRLSPFQPAFCCEGFFPQWKSVSPVSSGLVTKTSNLVLPDDNVSTLNQSKPARKKPEVYLSSVLPLIPTLTSSIDNDTSWLFAQKHCSDLLGDEQRWNPEAFWGLAWNRHQVDDRPTMMRLSGPFPLSYQRFKLLPLTSENNPALLRGMAIGHFFFVDYCFNSRTKLLDYTG